MTIRAAIGPGAGPAEIVKLVKLPLLIADESPLLAAGSPPHVLLSAQTSGEKCIHRTQFYYFTSSEMVQSILNKFKFNQYIYVYDTAVSSFVKFTVVGIQGGNQLV